MAIAWWLGWVISPLANLYLGIHLSIKTRNLGQRPVNVDQFFSQLMLPQFLLAVFGVVAVATGLLFIRFVAMTHARQKKTFAAWRDEMDNDR